MSHALLFTGHLIFGKNKLIAEVTLNPLRVQKGEDALHRAVYYSMPCVWIVCLAQHTYNYGVKYPVVPLSQD